MKARTWASACAVSVAGLFGLVSRSTEVKTDEHQQGAFGRYLQEVSDRLDKYEPAEGWGNISKREPYASVSLNGSAVAAPLNSIGQHVSPPDSARPKLIVRQDIAEVLSGAAVDFKSEFAFSAYMTAFNKIIDNYKNLEDEDKDQITKQFFNMGWKDFLRSMDNTLLAKQNSLHYSIDSVGSDFGNLDKGVYCQLLADLQSMSYVLDARIDSQAAAMEISPDLLREKQKNFELRAAAHSHASAPDRCSKLEIG